MLTQRKSALPRAAALLALAAAAGVAPAAVPVAADPCGGDPHCFNSGTFIAQIQQVSPSAMGNGARNHLVTFNVRFRNISDKPIILAYQAGSSSGSDNYGNVYGYGRPSTHDVSVKGIGMVEGHSADPQFTLSPGQTRNAMFGIIRFNAKAPVGTAFSYNVVIDELAVLADQTHSLQTLRQNSLSFSNLTAATTIAANLPGDTLAPAGNGTQPQAASTDPMHLAEQVLDLFKKAKQ